MGERGGLIVLALSALLLAGCETELAREQTFLNECHDKGFTSQQCDLLWRNGGNNG